jgi:hypothetical protein
VFCFPVRSELLHAFLLVTLLLLASGRLAAVEPSTDPAAADQLKQLNDQTIIGTRVSLDSEWDQFNHGAEKAMWTVAGLWGWRLSDSQDWGVRFRLPVVYHRSDQASGHAEVSGLGDVEIGTGTAFRLNDTWRTGGGIELHADTASDRAFAERVWRLKSGWGIAHDITHWLSLTLNADYNHSIAEKDEVRPHRYFELSLPATFLLPQAWSVSLKCKATVDFENRDRWTQMLTAGVAKRLSMVPIVVSATLGKAAQRWRRDVSGKLHDSLLFRKTSRVEIDRCIKKILTWLKRTRIIRWLLNYKLTKMKSLFSSFFNPGHRLIRSRSVHHFCGNLYRRHPSSSGNCNAKARGICLGTGARPGRTSAYRGQYHRPGGVCISERYPHCAVQCQHGAAGTSDSNGRFHDFGKRGSSYLEHLQRAEMPYMERVTWGGIALHAGNLPGYLTRMGAFGCCWNSPSCSSE